MRLLTHTNILVDDFEMCKDYKKNTFIHFLTHFHFDHWQGLSPLWNYGVIFCTEITKKFILQKFPKIQNICTLELNKTYRLDLISQSLIKENAELISDFVVNVSIFDANHIPGACMLLFQGYMGTILHTGDFRFTQSMIYNNEILFPREMVLNKLLHEINDKCSYEEFVSQNLILMKNISIQVDELIFDNTYCNKMFDFPLAKDVTKQMIDIINQNPQKTVYIAMGALGKEEICISLSRHFQTLLVVSQSKFDQIEGSGCMDLSIFTVDPEKGWIHIVKRKRGQEIIQSLRASAKSNDFICITTDFLMLEHTNPDQTNYIVPYSLHSNYKEMEIFVRAVRPAILKKLVIPFEQFSEYRRKVRINPLKSFKGYLKRLEQDGKSGYSYFINNHTDFTKLSPQYLNWMHEGISQDILVKLNIESEPNRKYRKRRVDQVPQKVGPAQMIRQLEQEYVFGMQRIKNKQTLEEVALTLKATNKNQFIDDFFSKAQKQVEITQLVTKNFEKIDLFQDKEIAELLNQFSIKRI